MKYCATKSDKRKYVLKEDRDLEVLGKCKMLKRKKLSREDKELVRFILTQLEDDWRKPLVAMTNKLVKKYKI
jgi:hypothetical protein